ncbi:MAG: acyl-CoA dehydrogenase family protein [Acidimicrobiales bacterium]
MTATDLDEFTAEAAAWLDANAKRVDDNAEAPVFVWGEGELDVAVFHAFEHDEEAAYLARIAEWNQRKAEKGYHAITWPTEYGGLGLGRAHARAFGKLARGYEHPGGHELFGVTTNLVAQTVRAFGTDEQKLEWLPMLLRADQFCCQLFSEPGAGSDLAGLSCRATQDGDEWVLNGQKVWSSGAQFSDWGLLIARTDPDVVKHKGLTAFVIPMGVEGIEVRPIKQMSGGQSFGEVFFSDARIDDRYRLGPVGEGWKVAMTTLGFERDHSSDGSGGGGTGGASWTKLLATAQVMGVTEDPVMRDELAKVYIHTRVESLLNRRAADLARSGTPGPEGSLGKIFWTQGMRVMSDAVSKVLGPRLIADSGEWGTYAWGEQVLGAPGYRIAGGSDEIQRNIIGERVLGLPGEPRTDKGPWKDVPR